MNQTHSSDGELKDLEARLLRLEREGGWKGCHIPGPPHAQTFKEGVTRVPPKWTPGFKHTKEGFCIAESRRQINNYAKLVGLEKE